MWTISTTTQWITILWDAKMEDKDMRQMIADFKAIMADKWQRRDFISGFICVMMVLVELYMIIAIFG